MGLYIPNYHWCIPLSTNISNGFWLYIPLSMLIHYSHPQIDGRVNHHWISRDLLFHLFGDDYKHISQFISRPKAILENGGKTGATPLYVAALNGSRQVVNLLLEAPGDTDGKWPGKCPGKHGKTLEKVGFFMVLSWSILKCWVLCWVLMVLMGKVGSINHSKPNFHCPTMGKCGIYGGYIVQIMG